MGELHRVESPSTGTVSTVGVGRGYTTTLSYRADTSLLGRETGLMSSSSSSIAVRFITSPTRRDRSKASSKAPSEPSKTSQHACSWASSSAVLGVFVARVPAEIASIEWSASRRVLGARPMMIRSHGGDFPTDPLSAILLLRRKDPPCSDPGPLPVFSCAVPSLPATLFFSCPQHTLPSLSPSRAPAFLPPRFHHLLLFEPSVALELWFARQRYSPSPCPLPALFTAPITSIRSRGPDRVGPRCAIAMFYFGQGAQQEEIQIYLTLRVPRRAIDPPAQRTTTHPRGDLLDLSLSISLNPLP